MVPTILGFDGNNYILGHFGLHWFDGARFSALRWVCFFFLQDMHPILDFFF